MSKVTIGYQVSIQNSNSWHFFCFHDATNLQTKILFLDRTLVKDEHVHVLKSELLQKPPKELHQYQSKDFKDKNIKNILGGCARLLREQPVFPSEVDVFHYQKNCYDHFCSISNWLCLAATFCLPNNGKVNYSSIGCEMWSYSLKLYLWINLIGRKMSKGN